MKRKINFLLENIRRFQINTRKHLPGRFLYAWISFAFCFIIFGCSFDDFFRYKFYEKSNYERNKFVTYRRSRRIIKQYNDVKEIGILQDKVRFNGYFHEYIGREWLDLRTATAEEFEEFVKTHESVLMKPLRGGQGKGIYKLTAKELIDGKAVLEQDREFVAEEILVQHKDMKKLNHTSVNTVRVLTFKNQVVACALRTGGDGAIVDNLHSNGVCAHVDIQTGIVDYPCIDNAYNVYLYHPTSGEKMVGFQIPNWSSVKETVRKAASMIPGIAYIGWDVAILEDGVALIEGNHDPGHDVVQMIAQTGIYEDINGLK